MGLGAGYTSRARSGNLSGGFGEAGSTVDTTTMEGLSSMDWKRWEGVR